MAVAILLKPIIGLVVVGLASQQVQAQGTLWYTTYIQGSLIGRVYGPEVSDPSVAKVGNTEGEIPSGTQIYTGSGLEGSGWSVQLFAVRGGGQLEGSLTPVATTLTSFRTGAAAGIIFGGDQQIPGIGIGQTGTFQLRAWDNQGEAVSSWSAAEPLWLNGSLAAGKSILFDVQLNSPTQLGAELLGFRSFNVYLIPEPGTLALAGLGTVACLFLRRRLRR